MSAHQDKDFYKVFIGVIAGLIFFTFSIAVLANKFSPDFQPEQDPMVQAQLKDRLMPIGKSRIAE